MQKDSLHVLAHPEMARARMQVLHSKIDYYRNNSNAGISRAEYDGLVREFNYLKDIYPQFAEFEAIEKVPEKS